VDIQETIPLGNLPLTQKQLTSTTLEQLASEMPVSKHVVAQGGIPLKLGYCAVLVEVALMDELAVRLEVEVVLAFLVEEPDGDELGDVRDAV